jgi:hypothetical protein
LVRVDLGLELVVVEGHHLVVVLFFLLFFDAVMFFWKPRGEESTQSVGEEIGERIDTCPYIIPPSFF